MSEFKKVTVPKSANASIAAKVTPKVIAGLAIGIEILKNISNCEAPKFGHSHKVLFDCSRNASSKNIYIWINNKRNHDNTTK